MMTASTRWRRATWIASRSESACRVAKQPPPAASMRGRSGGGRTVQTVTMRDHGNAHISTHGHGAYISALSNRRDPGANSRVQHVERHGAGPQHLIMKRA